MLVRPIALCLSVLLSTGVSARSPGDQLTVVAPPESAMSYEKWSNRTTARLNHSIQRSVNQSGGSAVTGYARVLFTLNATGRPEGVALAEPSSSSSIDRISVRAVRALGTLTPLPQKISPNSRFEAWIVVANDVWERDDMLNQLRAAHHARTMAQAAGESPVLIAAR